MHEQFGRVSQSVEIHLLYASIVWLAAWLLTSLRRGTATTKYWIWVATSLNFMLPLTAVPGRFWPSRFSWFTPGSIIGAVQSGISRGARAPELMFFIWSLGTALMLIRLALRTDDNLRGAGGARDLTPAVYGLLRPRISLPDGIEQRLTGRELNAVLLHERTHAKRRDNLIRLIHELSLCALWFHPLVWITGSRLALYRELSCDESVTRCDHGRDLVSALAKLATPKDAPLLRSTASSFISLRLAHLTTGRTDETYGLANGMLAIVFGTVLLAAAIGPIAQSAAEYACALTRGSQSGTTR